MQFIPTTWARWATDGDGDGDADPHNLYDAAASAAAYLCRGRDLSVEEGLRQAYFSYNHSQSYVETVLAHAYAYRELVLPLVPPS
jgi:membrane-bound lytic murein transglycosylase B